MYKYELHCHTSEVSACGKTEAKDMVEFYKSIGFSGIAITDHFFNGNCAVPKDLPWQERVELYCKGYENAKEHGDKIGIKVFFGIECSYGGNDLIAFGISKEWLLENEDCDKLRPDEFCDLVHKSGGFVIHAHPFREREYISMIKLLPRKVDAVEIINSCNNDFENNMANLYAQNYGLKITAGSDNHFGKLERIAAVETEKEAESICNIIDAIKENKQKIKHYTLSDDLKLTEICSV